MAYPFRDNSAATDATLSVEAAKDHILEMSVAQLKYAVGNGYSKTVQPWCGEVKWFKDELGQIWTKFKVLDARETNVETHVIPAKNVVEVVYNSRPARG